MLTSATVLKKCLQKVICSLQNTHIARFSSSTCTHCKIFQQHLRLDGVSKKSDLTAAIFLAFSTSHLWALIFPPSLLSHSIPPASQSLRLANIDLAK